MRQKCETGNKIKIDKNENKLLYQFDLKIANY